MNRKQRLSLSVLLILIFTVMNVGCASAPEKSIKLEKSEIKLEQGETFVLKASVAPSNTANEILNFSSGNEKVALVDANGKITAIDPGTTVIKVASVDNKIEANCTVTVVGKQVLTLNWLMWCDAPADEDAPVKKLFEEKFGVKFNLWYVERSKWDEILNIRFATGEIPDVFTANTTTSFFKYVDQEIIAEVSKDTIEKYAPELISVVDGYDPGAWKYSQINGKNYGIPIYNYNNKYHIVSVWREDWLKNVEIQQVPKTLDEFENAFYKFRNEDPDKNGKKDTYAISDKGIYNSIFGAFGFLPRDLTSTAALWKDVDGKLVYSGVQPEMKEALKLLQKWYKDGIIDPEFVTGENTSGHWSNSQAFSNGRIGYTASGTFYHVNPPMVSGDVGGTFYEEFKKIQGNAASYVIGQPPAGPSNKFGNFQGPTIGVFIVFGRQVANDTSKLSKILQIIGTIATDKELYQAATLGIKGTHWQEETKVIDGKEDRVVISKEGFKTNAEKAKIGAQSQFLMGGLYTKEFRVNADLLTKTKYDWAEKNANFGGISNALLVELPSGSKYNPILDKLREQVYLQIITGENDISYFDEYVEQWKKNGGEQLVKEANEWYQKMK